MRREEDQQRSLARRRWITFGWHCAATAKVAVVVTTAPDPGPPLDIGFLACKLFIKNILSPSYDLYFEYQLYHCILHDETNKTRSLLHIF